jgi:hypothetical protein
MNPDVVIDDRMIAWKIILQHGVHIFDYRQISTLAINKSLKKILKETADGRKRYLAQQFNLGSDYIWHPDGAMCGKAKIHDAGLHRSRYYLCPDSDSYGCSRYQPGSVYSNTFVSYLPCLSKPYFNNRGNFCLYAYGDFTKMFDKKNDRVVQYKWNSSTEIREMDLVVNQCVTNIKNNSNQYIDLKIFLEFPILLKAFLKSKVIYKRKEKWGMDKKVYAIEGVKISQNYKNHKPYFPTRNYASFKYLPKNVRKAINLRYKEQDKKDTGSMCN